MQLKLSTFFARQPGPAPSGAQPKPKPKAWACGQCTYVNGPDETRCEMCSAPAAASSSTVSGRSAVGAGCGSRGG